MNEEQFGRRIGRRLRDTAVDELTVDPAGLIAQADARRRRRRMITPVLVMVLLLCSAAGVYGVTSHADRSPAPAGRITAVPASPTARTGTDQVHLDLDRLRFAAGSKADRLRELNIIEAGVWRPWGNADPVALNLPKGRRTVDYLSAGGASDGGVRLLVHVDAGSGEPAETTMYTSTGKRTELKINGTQFTPGPHAAVLWRDESSHGNTVVIGRLDLDGSRRTYRVVVKDPQHADFVATGKALYIDDGSSVTRYRFTTSGLGKPERLRDYTEVVSADPSTDTAILAVHRDGRTCSAVVAGGALRWWTCDYTLTAQSGEGKYLYGYATDRSLHQAAVFSAGGTPILQLSGTDATRANFDGYNRVNFVLTQADGAAGRRSAVVTCALSSCSLSTAILPDNGTRPPYSLVLGN